MADTDFNALPATASILGTDSLVVVRGGTPYRFTGTLPEFPGGGGIAATGTIVGKSSEGFRASGAPGFYSFFNQAQTQRWGYMFHDGTNLLFHNDQAGPILFETNNVAVARFDQSGNFLVGVSTGNQHALTKAVAQGVELAYIRSSSTGQMSAQFYAVSAENYTTAGTAIVVGRNTVTGRSINAGGTVNASGADYAEYVRKAAGCGDIAKGDVCGVDRDGFLTKKWGDAISFVVKSTDPSYVGGDGWASHLGPPPEPPVDDGPPSPPPLDFDGNARPIPGKKRARTRKVFEAEVAKYQAAVVKFAEALETARQAVDRVAFCGQVPVNVDEDTLAACEAALADGVALYLVAAANSGGIRALAVPAPEFFASWEHQSRRLGKLWAVREGQVIIDVQHA